MSTPPTTTLHKDVRTLTISSNDMIAKKRALINVSKLLFDGDKVVADPQFGAYFSSDAHPALLRCVTDPKEKIRDLSLQLLIKVVSCEEMKAFDFNALLSDFTSGPFKRGFANASPKPFEEPAEEIRLLLVKLVVALVVHPSVQSSDSFSSICEGLARALSDNFPEVKRECCLLIAKLSKKGAKAIRMHAESLIKQLNSNLNHQHSKTRQMTVKAIGFVLAADGGVTTAPEKLMIETVLPSLKKTTFDQIPTVRKALVSCLGRVLSLALASTDEGEADPDAMVVDAESRMREGDPEGEGESKCAYGPFIPTLISFLLSICCDEVADVAGVARAELASLAQVGDESVFKFAEGATDQEKATRLVAAYFEKILLLLVADASHWTSGQREKSLNTMTTLIEYTDAGDTSLFSNLEVVVACLSSAIGDDEEAVSKSTERCATTLGSKLGKSSAALEILLPRIDGSISGMNTPEKLVGSLLILSAILNGSETQSVVAVAGKISSALASASILESPDRYLLEALLAALQSFTSKISSQYPQGTDVTLNLLLSCVYLLGADVNFDLRDGAREAVEEIAGCCGCGGDIGRLFDGEFVRLVDRLRGEPEHTVVWSNGSDPNLRAFDALMRISGEAGGKHFASVIDIFESHMNVENEPDSRLVMMALLESVLNDKKVAKYVKGFTSKLINDVVAPNIVWRAGGVASTIRKVSIACLFTILKSDTVDTQTLFMAAPKLLPILKTNLGDYDASSRQLCCLSLGIIFAGLPGGLGMEPVHHLYPDLLKCLDDSSDDVRFAACGTLKVFLKSAPAEHFKGTLMDYLCDQLLIHMDDPDPVIQRSVFDILAVAVEVDRAVVKKKATSTRNSHRDVRLCDALIKLCGE